MTQNIEQRTLAATTTIEGAAKSVDEIAHTDKEVQTPAGYRKSFPKISREWDQESMRLQNEWKNDSANIRQNWQSERNELSTKALGIKPWEAGSSEININQQRRWTDNHTYLPKTVPAVMTAEGPDDNWIPYTADKSDTLNDVFSRKPIDLVNGVVLIPDEKHQYPKINAFGKLWEIDDGSLQLTVKSFVESSDRHLVVTLADDSVIIGNQISSATRAWVESTTFIRKDSFVRANEEALAGLYREGSVIETLGYYNPYDGGGCQYEVKNGLLVRTPKSPVTYKQFGAVGGGEVDCIQNLIDAHAYANFHNLPVEGDGDKYLIQGAGCIDVHTDTNLNGSEYVLARTGTAPWISITPSKGKEEQPLSQALIDLMRPHLKTGTTYIPGLGNDHEALQSYVYIATDHILTERVGYNYFIYAQDSFTLLRDGNMIGQLITDLRPGQITSAVYKPLENSTLTFKNFNIALNFDSEYIPKFSISRNQVDIKEFSVRRVARNIMATDGVGELFSVKRCYKIAFDTADGDAIGFGHYGNGAYGYMISCSNVVDLTINRFQGNGGWGITGSNWLKDVNVTNSQINRWDIHFGMGNVTIRDSEFYGYGVNVTYGDGQLLLDNVKLYPQYTKGVDGVEVSYMSGWLVGSGSSYGYWWRGSIVIKDPEIWFDPESSKDSFKFIYSPSLSSEYSALGTLTLGTQWKVLRAKVRYMHAPPSDEKEINIYGAWIGGKYSRRFRLPSSIVIDGIDFDTSHKKTYLHGFVIDRPPVWSDTDKVYPSRCEVVIKGIKNQMADWELMNVKYYPEHALRVSALKKYSLVDFCLYDQYGLPSMENSLCQFEVSIEDSKGTFYDAYFNHELTISNSKILQPRVSVNAGGTRRITNSEIWPMPSETSQICLAGEWIANLNTIRRSKLEGYAEPTTINASGFMCSMGNLLEKGGTYDDESINMLWLRQAPNPMWEVPSSAAPVQTDPIPTS